MTKINKHFISKNLRIYMAANELTISGLAKKCNLSKHQIDNVLYKRSCSKEAINKICNTLNVSLDELSYSSSLDLPYKEFNVSAYNTLSGYVDKFISDNNIEISKQQMETIIHIVYNNKFSNKKDAVTAIMLYMLEQGEFIK